MKTRTIAAVAAATLLLGSGTAVAIAADDSGPPTASASPYDQAEAQASLDEERSRTLDENPAYEGVIAGKYLDDSGRLVARVFADVDENGLSVPVTDANGFSVSVTASAYTAAQIAAFYAAIPAIAQEQAATFAGGFSAEYDARDDVFLFTGEVDPAVISTHLGELWYEIEHAEGLRRF